MAQKIRKERITKVEWYNRGGFANSALFRQQSRGGAWRYYVNLERDAEQRQSIGESFSGTITGRIKSEFNPPMHNLPRTSK